MRRYTKVINQWHEETAGELGKYMINSRCLLYFALTFNYEPNVFHFASWNQEPFSMHTNGSSQLVWRKYFVFRTPFAEQLPRPVPLSQYLMNALLRLISRRRHKTSPLCVQVGIILVGAVTKWGKNTTFWAFPNLQALEKLFQLFHRLLFRLASVHGCQTSRI